MPREIEPSINEQEFVLEALGAGVRVDGRACNDLRSLSISFGKQYGHVDVSLGKTRILAKVSCEVARPYPDRPTEGLFVISTEFSPMASSAVEPGRPSEEEVLVSRLIEKAVRRSRAIDTEGLCIAAGEKVWSIRVDLHFLDHDGNVADCACIAAVTGLLHFRRPDVSVVGEEVTIFPIEERNPVPLSVHHIPVCISFAFFGEGGQRVVDPCLLEERIQNGGMTIAINVHKEICCLSKAGGMPLDSDQVTSCINLAYAKASEITDAIKAALERDAHARQSNYAKSKVPQKAGYVGLERTGI